MQTGKLGPHHRFTLCYRDQFWIYNIRIFDVNASTSNVQNSWMIQTTRKGRTSRPRPARAMACSPDPHDASSTFLTFSPSNAEAKAWCVGVWESQRMWRWYVVLVWHRSGLHVPFFWLCARVHVYLNSTFSPSHAEAKAWWVCVKDREGRCAVLRCACLIKKWVVHVAFLTACSCINMYWCLQMLRWRPGVCVRDRRSQRMRV